MRARSFASERCDFCGGKAVAYQRGSRVCGQCGTLRTLDKSSVPARTRRMAIVGFLSSGLLIKMMLGYVALAAMGSWAAHTVLAPPPPPVLTTPTTSTTVPPAFGEAPVPTEQTVIAEERAASVDEVVSTANDQASRAHDFAAATQEWADCVSASAIAHRGVGLMPVEECADRPSPWEFGLGEGNGPPEAPPGWNSKPEEPANSNAQDAKPNDEEPSNDASAAEEVKDKQPNDGKWEQAEDDEPQPNKDRQDKDG